MYDDTPQSLRDSLCEMNRAWAEYCREADTYDAQVYGTSELRRLDREYRECCRRYEEERYRYYDRRARGEL